MLYELRISKWLIRPYALFNYSNGMSYLSEFGPASGTTRYLNFQDFFTRKILSPRKLSGPFVWPCDGLVCESGKLEDINVVSVKGELRTVEAIFGKDFALPENAYFVNIFLHNSDYHRVHAPVSGQITKIIHIPGELRFLRPWIYEQPSLPALTNERINIEITASGENGSPRKWALSIVGGPGVSTIELAEGIRLGASVDAGQELRLFKLGSTCCMVSPIHVFHEPGFKVRMGNSLTFKA
jgi:phosphatidylserine decarboxylase